MFYWLTREKRTTESCEHNPTVGQHSLQNNKKIIVPKNPAIPGHCEKEKTVWDGALGKDQIFGERLELGTKSVSVESTEKISKPIITPANKTNTELYVMQSEQNPEFTQTALQ